MEQSISTYSDAALYAMMRDEATKQVSFAELYARHSTRIFLYCRRALGDNHAADDLFQEIFISFLKSSAGNQDVENVAAYLVRIARNAVLNSKRSPQPAMISLEDFHLPMSDNRYESQEITELIASALDTLPDDQRECFALQLYSGLTYAEIAEVMNLPLTTVRNRVVRAKRRIREILAPYFEEYL